MKVLVYVEGDGDRAALETVFESVIGTGKKRGVGVRFLPLHGKAAVLDDSGRKAANHLQEHPRDWVFALPDLYPLAAYNGTHNAHRSFPDLLRLLRTRFDARAAAIGVPPAAHTHFRVHTLKYDLEALLLAAPDILRQRLHTRDALRGQWRNPVEDQDDDRPPKRIIEALFVRYLRRDYVPTTDAPWILQRASLADIRRACRQQFAPFADELERIIAGRRLDPQDA